MGVESWCLMKCANCECEEIVAYARLKWYEIIFISIWRELITHKFQSTKKKFVNRILTTLFNSRLRYELATLYWLTFPTFRKSECHQFQAELHEILLQWNKVSLRLAYLRIQMLE